MGGILGRIKRIRQLSIGRQIILFYLVIMIFTVIVCTLLYVYFIADTVDESENKSIERSVNSIKTDFSTVLNRAHEYSKIIGFNEDIQAALRNASVSQYQPDLLNANQAVIRLVTGSTFISSVYIFDNVGNMYFSANDYRRTPAEQHGMTKSLSRTVPTSFSSTPAGSFSSSPMKRVIYRLSGSSTI